MTLCPVIGFRLDNAASGGSGAAPEPHRRADSSPLHSYPRRGIVLTMKTLFQAGRNRCVSVPPEKRFLINSFLFVDIEIGIEIDSPVGDSERLSSSAMFLNPRFFRSRPS